LVDNFIKHLSNAENNTVCDDLLNSQKWNTSVSIFLRNTKYCC
jgi:hypothetical protein